MTEPNDFKVSGAPESPASPGSAGPAAASPGDASDDALVDEFAGIEPAPPRRSPILALVIIGLSLATTYHLRDDLRYALTARAPAPLAELRGAGQPILGRYVSVRGIPDRRNSLYVETRGDKTRESFFRLLDADPPIFVRARDTALRNELSAEWVGRLRRFSDTPYASSLRDYFARGVQISRGLELSAFRSALEATTPAARLHLRDRSGRELALSDPDALIEIETRPADYLLELRRDKYPKLADAELELARVVAPFGVRTSSSLGGIEGARDAQDDPEVFRFWTPLLETDLPKRNALFAALEAAGIEFSLAHPRGSYKLSDLGFEAASQALTFKTSKHQQPWAEVIAVTVQEPLRIDDAALVLTEGEAPAAFVWAPLVAALLLALAAWNAWYLLRPRRAS